jgi:hypothetical protein
VRCTEPGVEDTVGPGADDALDDALEVPVDDVAGPGSGPGVTQPARRRAAASAAAAPVRQLMGAA